jgi:Ca2+-binding EF-hand superfamily protein
MVKEILTLLGHEVNDDELEEVMEEFDEDNNGTIEFAEFIKLAEEFVEPEQDYIEAKKDLREMFLMYDRERKGFIPVADFKAILKELEKDLSDGEADEIVKELDTDFSGTIEWEGKSEL